MKYFLLVLLNLALSNALAADSIDRQSVIVFFERVNTIGVRGSQISIIGDGEVQLESPRSVVRKGTLNLKLSSDCKEVAIAAATAANSFLHIHGVVEMDSGNRGLFLVKNSDLECILTRER